MVFVSLVISTWIEDKLGFFIEKARRNNSRNHLSWPIVEDNDSNTSARTI
jgi:hypothetical protein